MLSCFTFMSWRFFRSWQFEMSLFYMRFLISSFRLLFWTIISINNLSTFFLSSFIFYISDLNQLISLLRLIMVCWSSLAFWFRLRISFLYDWRVLSSKILNCCSLSNIFSVCVLICLPKIAKSMSLTDAFVNFWAPLKSDEASSVSS